MRYVHASAEDYLAAIPQSSIDVCISIFGAFSFTDDPVALLRRTAGALKPGGLLLVVLRADDSHDYVLLLRRKAK